MMSDYMCWAIVKHFGQRVLFLNVLHK